MNAMRIAARVALANLLLVGGFWAGLPATDPAWAQAAVAPGRVHVTYVAPERFTDVGDDFGSGAPLRVTLAEMTDILQRLGRTYLRPGETLDLSVLDIDRAGFERPGFGTASGVRVVTDATPPRIRLAYVLRRGGRPVARGEDVVTDINYTLTANPRFSTGPLSYERAVLRDWFARRFPPPQDGRG